MDERNMHSGHRRRLKDRFQKEGLESFDQINALELLLFYCVPRRNTNDLAHRLLDRFGTFDKVLDASPEQMEQVEGVGSQISSFFHLLRETSRYYRIVKDGSGDQIMGDIKDCGTRMESFFSNQRNEVVYLLIMDAKRKVLSCDFIGEGSVNSASVPIRRIVETALRAGASIVVLGHNHPSGLALPSNEDIQTTKLLARALRSVDVILWDHLVFADGDYVSLTQSGSYDPNRDSAL